MPMFKNPTIILINVIGLAILLGATALIVSKLPPAGNDNSHSLWIVFFTLFVVFSIVSLAASRRRKTQSKTVVENKNIDGDDA